VYGEGGAGVLVGIMLDWTMQAAFGAFPPPTFDFSAVGLNNKLYVFGVCTPPALLPLQDTRVLVAVALMVSACMGSCMHACMRACVRACVRECVCSCVRVLA
jgi:hypothetical protein